MKTRSRNESARRLAAITVGLCLTAAPAVAGIADSPLPVLETGKKTYHLYSVPGVVALPYLATYFSCSSTGTVAMKVGVEVFGSLGGGPVNDAAASSVTLLPGATVVFGTSPAAWIVTSDVGSGNGIGRASARVLSTSKKLACTAFLADPANVPPTSMVSLTIIKRTTQKGE
jgi:hypothetical protein